MAKKIGNKLLLAAIIGIIAPAVCRGMEEKKIVEKKEKKIGKFKDNELIFDFKKDILPFTKDNLDIFLKADQLEFQKKFGEYLAKNAMRLLGAKMLSKTVNSLPPETISTNIDQLKENVSNLQEPLELITTLVQKAPPTDLLNIGKMIKKLKNRDELEFFKVINAIAERKDINDLNTQKLLSLYIEYGANNFESKPESLGAHSDRSDFKTPLSTLVKQNKNKAALAFFDTYYSDDAFKTNKMLMPNPTKKQSWTFDGAPEDRTLTPREVRFCILLTAAEDANNIKLIEAIYKNYQQYLQKPAIRKHLMTNTIRAKNITLLNLLLEKDTTLVNDAINAINESSLSKKDLEKSIISCFEKDSYKEELKKYFSTPEGFNNLIHLLDKNIIPAEIIQKDIVEDFGITKKEFTTRVNKLSNKLTDDLFWAASSQLYDTTETKPKKVATEQTTEAKPISYDKIYEQAGKIFDFSKQPYQYPWEEEETALEKVTNELVLAAYLAQSDWFNRNTMERNNFISYVHAILSSKNDKTFEVKMATSQLEKPGYQNVLKTNITKLLKKYPNAADKKTHKELATNIKKLQSIIK